MKKQTYQTPELEVVVFFQEDIIQTSPVAGLTGYDSASADSENWISRSWSFLN